MRSAVAGFLFASSAVLFGGCAAYPDAPGYYGGGYSPYGYGYGYAPAYGYDGGYSYVDDSCLPSGPYSGY